MTNHIVFISVALLLLFGLGSISGWYEAFCEFDVCNSGQLQVYLGTAVPIASEDINLVGEITPTALAGIMVVFAPRNNEHRHYTIAYAILFLVIYLLYLNVTIDLRSDEAVSAIVNHLDDGDPEASVILSSLVSLVGSIRLFAIVVVSALIGLWIQLALAQRRGAEIA